MAEQLINVAGVCLNQTPLDWDGNRDRICHFLREARGNGASVVVFPELCITGYNCEDMFYSQHARVMAEQSLGELLKETMGIVAVIGLPVYHQGALYNCVAVIQDGQILGLNPKKDLPREGVHYENRWFTSGIAGQSEQATFCGRSVPFGDLRYRFSNFCLAIEICEEGWRPQRAAARHTLQGADIIANPSASHFAFGKYATREAMVTDNSRSLQACYIHTNVLGLEAGRMIYDGGVLIGVQGRIEARGPIFGFADGYITYASVNTATIHAYKIKNRTEPAQASMGSAHEINVVQPLPQASRVFRNEPLPHKSLSKEEEFLFAEMLGLFDYWRKSKSQGFTVSLSGGCDSSAVCVLVAHMIRCALQELGPQEFAAKVRLKGMNPDQSDARAWIRQALTTVYQATDQSSEITRQAAAEVARALESRHFEINVQDAVDFYTKNAEQVLGRPLSWQTDDLALQNIQARTRAPMVWLLANLNGSLLLATSNRSEVAVGYATMDGDTAGGLAPLGGIDKAYLLQWLRWACYECTHGLGPIPALRHVIKQAPTAELRPKEFDQSDEKDLMPYEILTKIERLFIRDLLPPHAILSAIQRDYPQYDADRLKEFVERFLVLWSRHQWKRERYAPSFLVDDESLDPKTWCRFPILSGGFERELKELK